MITVPKISGFTIVRNAAFLNYPFRESVLSVLPLCEEFVIGLGDSTDNTGEICQDLQKAFPDKIRIFETHWERGSGGGFQLKKQTDFAMSKCVHPWCFYLQADEVIHEEDFPKIARALELAEGRNDIDGVVFDYIHFYGNYHNQIKGRNWYRREVRLFKNHRHISAFRDAQGFRKDGNRLRAVPSGARVFHYGYVRTPELMKKKSSQMALWWDSSPPTKDSEYDLVRHVGLRPYRDSHPRVMAERLKQNDRLIDPAKCRRKWDTKEIKNALTLAWESIIPYRIGEFRNYELTR